MNLHRLYGGTDLKEAFGGINPNSQHQMWSRWTFQVRADLRKVPRYIDCINNSRRFFKLLFGSVGRARCDQVGRDFTFTVELEGVPAHDPQYVKDVKRQFTKHFMHRGFGFSARLTLFEVGVLSGDKQDGKPPDQLLVLPQLSGV